MAGLLTAGPGAHLCRWTALAVFGLARDRAVVHVIAPRRRGTTARDVRIHRTDLDPADACVHEGFPVTTVERSIIDVGGEATDRQLGALLDGSLRRGIYDHKRMLLAIDRAYGQRGVGRVKAGVAKLGDEGELLRSDTERLVRDRLVQLGVRRALVNVPVQKGDGSHFELDLLWPALQLNVEIDGPHHLLPHQMAADAERDRWLRGRGMRVARFPVERVDNELATVAEEIRLLIETCSKK
jgi:very-short-patch-repair endonuclease